MEKVKVNEINEKAKLDPDYDRALIIDGKTGVPLKFDIHEYMKTFMGSIDTFYGVEWDTTISSPSMTRIGRTDLHQTLPIQSRMRGVLLNDSGEPVKYLNPTSWVNEVTDGSQGQVMVEIPEYYYRFEANGTKRRMLISEYDLPGFTKMPKVYMSAYEASLGASKLQSVSGVTAKTSYSRTNFRSSARARGNGWEMMFYNAYKSMLIMYFVEYANRNSQLAFNAQTDGSGYKQGGLGIGVTNIDSGEWNTHNGRNPFIDCGFSDSLGNNSGVVEFSVPFGTVATVEVNRYRGIELPFGHIWHNCDGINVDVKTDADGGTSRCYVCDDPAKFSDNGYDGYKEIGLLPRSSGYINEMLFGEFMPIDNGGGSTTYWCDNFYTSVTSSSLRTVLFGGNAYNGSNAGLAYSYSYNSPSYTTASIGSRLCFFKK